MAGGRPTKYSPKMLDKARLYIESFEADEKQPIPMIAGLAKHLKVAKSTIYLWADDEDRSEFSDVLKQIMEEQEMMLIAGGLTNNFNAAITKLGLTKHGYTDKVESKTEMTLDVKQLTDEELEAVIDGRS